MSLLRSYELEIGYYDSQKKKGLTDLVDIPYQTTITLSLDRSKDNLRYTDH